MNMTAAVHLAPLWGDRAESLTIAPLEEAGHWEELPSRRTAADLFQICCIPFFAYGLSLGDEVEALRGDIGWVIHRVARRSGHQTFRIWFGDNAPATRAAVVAAIRDLGCDVEWSSHRLAAVDAPTNEVALRLVEYLRTSEELGRLTYESAAVKRVQ